jgi:hypothetical protein
LEVEMSDWTAGPKKEFVQDVRSQFVSAPRDAGLEREGGEQRTILQPQFDAVLSPSFKELPLEAPKGMSNEKQDRLVRWDWNPLDFVHRVNFFAFQLSAEVRVSQNDERPQKPQQWRVGFVQNFLGAQITFKYERSDERKLASSKVFIDQEGNEEPWLSPSQHPVQGLTVFDSVDLGSGSRMIRLAMNDLPHASYNHFKGGNQARQDVGEELQRVDHTLFFGTWILARPVEAPARELKSYKIVSGLHWSVSANLKVDKLPPPPPRMRKPSVAFEAGTYEASPISPDLKPVVVGPTANDRAWEQFREIVAP